MISIPLLLRLRLRDQPEYGMGYQLGIARLSSGATERGVILNGAAFATQDELGRLSPTELAVALAVSIASRLSIVDVTLIPRPPETLLGVRHVRTTLLNRQMKSAWYGANESIRASQGAEDSPITDTKDGEIFKRFSAYVDDFRITEKRGLKPGTFATTAEDALNVHTGREAIARYALKNKESANKRFTITPKPTRLQQGVVQPAYGEPGGGVEVIFVDGTSDNSVSQPDILPE